MKTLKQYITEDGKMVGTPEVNSVEDGNIGVHNISNQKVLERVNAFVGAIANQEYINPKAAMEQLSSKLTTLGLSFAIPEIENGVAVAEVSQFGGRFGKDIDGADIKDDGISHKKEGGLKSEFKTETLSNGASKVYAKLV